MNVHYPRVTLLESPDTPPLGERSGGKLEPPKNHDAEVIRGKARLMEGCVDAANITDNQTAVVRMSSIAAGAILLEEGIEPIIQMTCRDRNRLAMQADLLGAHALGISNVLCLSGDHQSLGDHPGAKNVHDIDSMQLIRMVKDMRDRSVFQSGVKIKGGGPRLFIGAAANPFADPTDWRPYRLAKKAMAGADFIQTQLIYDMRAFRDYMKRAVDLGVTERLSFIAGVGPLKSSGMAKYMRDHVPGMSIPDELVSRMEGMVADIDNERKEARRDAWRAEGIDICIEGIQEIREIEGVAGVHIMGIEWEEAIRPITERAGLLPRPGIE